MQLNFDFNQKQIEDNTSSTNNINPYLINNQETIVSIDPNNLEILFYNKCNFLFKNFFLNLQTRPRN